jgi:hypothetical protein
MASALVSGLLVFLYIVADDIGRISFVILLQDNYPRLPDAVGPCR